MCAAYWKRLCVPRACPPTRCLSRPPRFPPCCGAPWPWARSTTMRPTIRCSTAAPQCSGRSIPVAAPCAPPIPPTRTCSGWNASATASCVCRPALRGGCRSPICAWGWSPATASTLTWGRPSPPRARQRWKATCQPSNGSAPTCAPAWPGGGSACPIRLRAPCRACLACRPAGAIARPGKVQPPGLRLLPCPHLRKKKTGARGAGRQITLESMRDATDWLRSASPDLRPRAQDRP